MIQIIFDTILKKQPAEQLPAEQTRGQTGPSLVALQRRITL